MTTFYDKTQVVQKKKRNRSILKYKCAPLMAGPRANAIASGGYAINETQNTAIFQYALQLKRDGRADDTITTNVKLLKRLAQATDIMHPEAIKDVIANSKW